MTVFIDMSFTEAPQGYTIFGIKRGGEKEILRRHYPWYGVYVPKSSVGIATEKLKALPHVVDVVHDVNMIPVIDKRPYRLEPDPSCAVLKTVAERKEYVKGLANASLRVLGPDTRAGVYNIVYTVRASFDLGLRFFSDNPPLLFMPNKMLEELAIDVLEKNRDLKVMSFDIEVATEPGRFPIPGDPIISIQYATVRLDDASFADPAWPKENVVTLVANSKYESEELVEEFLNVVKRERPDIIVGYNSTHFDARYMAPFMPKNARFQRLTHLEIDNLVIPHIDLMTARDRMGSSLGVRSQRARTLPDVVREVVKGTPFEWVLTSPLMEAEERLDHTKLVQEWEQRTDLFYSYITADAYLTLILAYVWMPTFILLTAMTQIPPTTLIGLNTGQIAEYVLVRWYEWLGFEPIVMERTAEIKKVAHNMLYLLRKLTEKAELFGKGKVYVAGYGIHNGIAEGDFSQLYPTLMANDTIDPTAVRVLEKATLTGRRVRERYVDPVIETKTVRKAFPVVLGRPPISKEGKVKKNADYMEPTHYYLVVPTYGPASFLMYKMYTMRKITKKLKKRAKDEGRPELKAPDQAVKIMNNCYVPGTLVMTPDGPVPIENLRVGDKVFAVDTETGEVVITEVLRTWEYDYNGDIYILYTTAGELWATPEQNILIDEGGRPALKPVKDFEGRDVELPRLKPLASNAPPTPLMKYADIVEKLEEIEVSESSRRRLWSCCIAPEKMVIGWHGRTYTNMTPDPADLAVLTAAYIVGGMSTDSAVLIDLPPIFDTMKWLLRVARAVTNDVVLANRQLIIKSPVLVKYFTEEVGKHLRKKVPEWLLTAPLAVKGTFINAFRKLGKGVDEWVWVKDKETASELAKFMITAGYSVRLEKSYTWYRIYLIEKPRGRVIKLPYSGKVYDVSTKYGTIIAGTKNGFIPTGQSLYGSFSKRRGFINQVVAAYIFWKTLNLLYDVISFVEKDMRLRVLYGDTDSVFVKVGENKDEAREVFEKGVLPHINDFVRKKYGKEFNVDFEDSFDFCVYPKQKKSSRASKKTYICGDYVGEYPDVRVFKGEFYKTTAPMAIKEQLERFYAEILKRSPSTPEGVIAIMRELMVGSTPVRYFVKKIVDTFNAEIKPTDASTYITKLKNLNKPFHYAALHTALMYNLPGVEVETRDEKGNVVFRVDPDRVLSTGDIVVYYIPTDEPKHFYVYLNYDPEKDEVIYHDVRVVAVEILSERENGMIRHTGYRVIERYREVRASRETVLELSLKAMRKYVVADVVQKLLPALRIRSGPLTKYFNKQ